MLDLGGTLREQTAEKTLEWVTPFLKDFGISRVADITGLDSVGVHVYQAIRPQSKNISISQGKGSTPKLAKISAIMESIEGWHAENIPPPELYGSFRELSEKYPMIEPIPQKPQSAKIPLDFKSLRIYWIKAIDLFTGDSAYLPYNFFALDYTKDYPFLEHFLSNSNGLASGNTLDEAICHGLFEVIERDAIEKSYKKNHLHPIDLASINCCYINDAVEKLKQAKILTILADITSDIEIPTYCAWTVSGEDLRSARPLAMGYGTHLSKRIAASRAINEAIQSRLTFISGARDDLKEESYPITQGTLDTCRRFRDFDAKEGITPLFGTEPQIPKTLSECRAIILKLLKARGFDTAYYFDLTQKKYNIPVVHVYVPKLNHPQFY